MFALIKTWLKNLSKTTNAAPDMPEVLVVSSPNSNPPTPTPVPLALPAPSESEPEPVYAPKDLASLANAFFRMQERYNIRLDRGVWEAWNEAIRNM